ncbi:flagellar basal body rod protein FlgB [Chitinimonas sp.]|uniref:flagellar basal body rod protein FlgB n=1 Tax=Chitinimonas sp. TaxID=1934313 RepID=UPI0035B43075
MMISQTDAITHQLVALALDAASLRHQAIAHNIANAHTAGFAPARVDFEDQLATVRAALSEGRRLQPAMLQGVHAQLSHGLPQAGEDRSGELDSQIAELAQNTVQYQALLKALGKQMAILSAAVNEGKR